MPGKCHFRPGTVLIFVGSRTSRDSPGKTTVNLSSQLDPPNQIRDFLWCVSLVLILFRRGVSAPGRARFQWLLLLPRRGQEQIPAKAATASL